MDGAKSLVIAVVGLAVGVVLAIAVLVGAVLGVASRLAVRATNVPVESVLPQERIIAITGNESIDSMDREIARFLQAASFTGGITVSEEALTRFAAAFLQESSFESDFEPLSIGLDISTHRIAGSFSFRPDGAFAILPYFGAVKAPVTLAFATTVEQDGETIYLNPEQLAFGGIRVPVALLRWGMERFGPGGALQDTPVPAKRQGIAVSIRDMNEASSGLFLLREITAGEDSLQLILEPREHELNRVLEYAREVAIRDGIAIRAVLARHLHDAAVLQAVDRTVLQLAGYQGPREASADADLFWGTAETVRQVVGATADMSPEASEQMLKELTESVNVAAIMQQLEVQ